MTDINSETTATSLSEEELEDEEGSKLQLPDVLVIVAYFLFVLFVGLWSSCRSQRGTVSGYFLASRSMHWIPVGASLFASNIGSGHFIGLAGSGAASGIGVAGFEQSAIFILMLLGWVFVPVYMSSGIYTMPEYLRERFGGQRIRVYLSFLALLLYIFTKISADLYAGAIFIRLALNKTSDEWLYISILILLGIAAVFTIAGGLTAVLWTDFVQTIIMVLGAFILMGMSLNAVGGLERLVAEYPYAVPLSTNTTCNTPPSYYMSLLRPIDADLPWTGMVFGLTINSIWYWCTDQVIVQRTLSSRNMSHAKAGCILAAYLKFLPLWLLVIPGMAARVLYTERVACSDPAVCKKICRSPGGCTNIAYGELVLNLLPQGLTGLMLSVMMSALMSSLTSIFNSASTIFTIDVWTRFRKQSSETELLIVGRSFVLVLVVVSVIWIPVIENSPDAKLFDYIQSISSFLAPPICAVFLLAFFWTRTNEPGAFWGLMVGLIIGLTRFVLEFTFIAPPCGSGLKDTRPYLVKKLVGDIHYLHFSCFLFLITGAVAISVSLLTEPIPSEYLYRLTWWTRHSKEVRKNQIKFEGIVNEANEVESHTVSREQLNMEQQPQELSLWRRIFNIICGISPDPVSNVEKQPSVKQTEEEKASKAADFLKEDPYWRRFANINAVVCMTLTVFIWGFYA